MGNCASSRRQQAYAQLESVEQRYGVALSSLSSREHEISHLQEELDAARSQAFRATNANSEAEKRLVDLTARHATLEEANSKLRTELDVKTEEVAGQQRVIDLRVQERDEASKSSILLRFDLMRSEKATVNLQNQLDTLRNDAKVRQQQATLELEEVKKRLKASNDQHDCLQGSRGALVESLDVAEEEKLQLTATVQRLEEGQAELTQKLATADLYGYVTWLQRNWILQKDSRLKNQRRADRLIMTKKQQPSNRRR